MVRIDSIPMWAPNNTENYAYEALIPDQFDCIMTWNTQGVASSTTCIDCTFAFDVTMTYDSSSINNGLCDDLAIDRELTYGYIDDMMIWKLCTFDI